MRDKNPTGPTIPSYKKRRTHTLSGASSDRGEGKGWKGQYRKYVRYGSEHKYSDSVW